MIVISPVRTLGIESGKKNFSPKSPQRPDPHKNTFISCLKQENVKVPRKNLQPTGEIAPIPSPGLLPSSNPYHNTSAHNAGLAASPVKKLSFFEQIRSYKEEQLLSNPGGDSVEWQESRATIVPQSDDTPFLSRIEKDIKDASANFINFFKDIGTGSDFSYLNRRGEIVGAKKRGLLKIAGNFCRDLVSGLSLGRYSPEGTNIPKGIIGKIKFFCSQTLYKALFKDLALGIPEASLNIVEDAAFAAWNLLEVIPDATISCLPKGEKITSEIFDDVQVMGDYFTDILPGGEAWLRTRDLPFLLPILESKPSDVKWKFVNNTPFRKAIENIGSAFSGVLTRL